MVLNCIIKTLTVWRIFSFWASHRSHQAWQRRLREYFGFITEVWVFRALVDWSLWGLIPFVDVFLSVFIAFILPSISTIVNVVDAASAAFESVLFE